MQFACSRSRFLLNPWMLSVLTLGSFCLPMLGRGAMAQQSSPLPSPPPVPGAPTLPTSPSLPNAASFPCLPSLPLIRPLSYSPLSATRFRGSRSKIAVQYATLGQYDRAVEIALKLPEDSNKTYTLLDITDVALARGERDRAVALLEQVLQLSPTLDSPSIPLNEIAVRFAASGQAKRALQLARQLPRTEQNYLQRDNTINRIIVKLAEIGQLSQAEQLAQTAPEASKWIGRTIVREAVSQGEYNQAVAIARNLDDRCERAYALQQASTSLFRAGQEELALEVAQSIDEAKYKVEALTDIAAQLLETERTEEALPIFNLALEITPTLSPYPQTNALIAIARHLIAAGEEEQAEVLLGQALELSESELLPNLIPVPPPSRLESPRSQPERR